MSKKGRSTPKKRRSSPEEGYKVSRQPERSLITTRNIVVAILAAGGIYAYSQCASADTVEPAGATTSKEAAAEQTPKKPSLATLTQPELDYLPLTQQDNEKRMKLYEAVKGDVLAELEGLYGREHIEGNTADQDKVMRKLMKEFKATGFAEDLRDLVKANEGHDKKNELVIIPLNHGNSEIDNTPDKKSERRKGWDDIAGILEHFADQPHRIFLESEKAGPPSYVRWQKFMEEDKQKARDIKMSPADEKQALDGVEKIFRTSKVGQIVLNPRLKVFGLEHDELYDLIWKHKPDMMREATSNVTTVIFTYIINGILREQYAVEKAVQDLQPGERGFIVMGASHVTTIMRYIEDSHQSLQNRIIVPKHMWTKADRARQLKILKQLRNKR